MTLLQVRRYLHSLPWSSENRSQVATPQTEKSNNKPRSPLKEQSAKEMNLLLLGDEKLFFHKDRSHAKSTTCSFAIRSNINSNRHLKISIFPSATGLLLSLHAGSCLPASSPGAQREGRSGAPSSGLLSPWVYLPLHGGSVDPGQAFPSYS